MSDTRTWMYRDGEAVCFARPEDVPDGAGWRDSPARSAPDPHTDPVETDLAALRRRAAELGLRVHPRTGAQKLALRIREAEQHGA